MDNARQASSSRLILAAIAVLLGWLVLARGYVGCGWGWAPVALSDTRAAYGLMAEAGDTLFYVSFVEQARLGLVRFAMLFTTDEHAALLFNPYFLVVGSLARWFAWPPVFAYNISGLLGAILTVVFVVKCAEELGLGLRARIVAAFLVIFGSGLSWVARGAEKLGVTTVPRGADATFMDLFPSEAFLVYPYHACANALLALLLWLILRAERMPARGLVPLGLCALVLATIRPYEPVFLTAVYAARTLAARLGGGEITWRRCAAIGVVMAAGFAPGLAYAAWVSRQPVWSHFSNHATQLAQGRDVILMGFGLIWLLAALGCRAWTRPWSGRAALLTWWWLAAVVLLLGLNAGAVKLAGGSTLAAALLAATALEKILAAERRPRLVISLAILALIFALSASHVFLLRTFKATVPALDPQLLAVGEAIRRHAGETSPRVLSDPASGAVLSGLFGVRSFASHPLLTPRYDEKVAALRAAGFLHDRRPGDPPLRAFDEVSRTSGVSFVVCANDMPALQSLREGPSWQPILETTRWSVYRALQIPNDGRAGTR